ncbi:MAG TPA: diaminopimelate epimerase [Tepidisphaeraceae bacterium]|jgi:diaminopimelate epimerase|nr:diaminopimelate epimerase [Tepidisphaeraceae bacterium]
MRFTKMHGIGNDYVYVNGFTEAVANPAEIAKKVSDRHFGIGSDGLILILPSEKADVRMRMFNADGSEAEMCGNGVRCVAKYAFDHGLTRNNPMTVETGRGVLSLALEVGADTKVLQVTVNMGEPILELAKIPVDFPRSIGSEQVIDFPMGKYIPLDERARDHILDIAGSDRKMTCVSVGNPHLVSYCTRLSDLDLERIGPFLERQPIFPRRINVHFVQAHSRSEVTMRTWERGSGITLACGTGACAVCVAGVLTGRTDRKILAHLPGGDLQLEWREADNNVYMTGPATQVFSGDWEET